MINIKELPLVNVVLKDGSDKTVLNDNRESNSSSLFHNEIFNNLANYNNLYEFRSKFRLSDSVFDGNTQEYNVDNLKSYTNGSSVINVDGIRFNTFLFSSNTPKLYVSLTSGSRKKGQDVLFTRWKWRNYFDGYFLAIDDPMFEFNKKFPKNLMGWFYGTSKNNFLDKTAQLIKAFAESKGIRYEDIFLMGSSSGATASLYISNELAGCSTMAFNPQVSLSDWPFAKNFEQVANVNLKTNDKRNVIRISKNSNNKYFIYYNLLSEEDTIQMRSLLNSIGCQERKISYGLNKLTDNIYLMASVINYHKLHTTSPNEYETYIISRFLEADSAERERICCNEFFTYMTENVSKRYEMMDSFHKLKTASTNIYTEMSQYADSAFERHLAGKNYSDVLNDYKALFYLKSFSLPNSYFKGVVRSLKALNFSKQQISDYFGACTSNNINKVNNIISDMKSGDFAESKIMNSFTDVVDSLFKSSAVTSLYKEAFSILCKALKKKEFPSPIMDSCHNIKYAILSNTVISDDLSFTDNLDKSNCFFVSEVCNLIGFSKGYSGFVAYVNDRERLVNHTIDFFFRNLLGCLGFKSVAQYKQISAAYNYSHGVMRQKDYALQIRYISTILAMILTTDEPEQYIKQLGNELIWLVTIALDLPSDKFLIFKNLTHIGMENCRNYLNFIPEEQVKIF